MVSSWKSFLSLYCSCGPLHEDDVELRNVRHISGPLNLPRTASVPAIIMTDPTEEVIDGNVATRTAHADAPAPAPAPTSPKRKL